MRPTVEYIRERFELFNRRMFGGRLPAIPIRLSNAATYLGQCVSRVSTDADGVRRHTDFELRISTRLDLPRDTVDDTLIHEMIHYFIHYNGLQDTSAHGPIFRSIMHSINVTHGRNLTISHKSTPEERAASHTGGRRAWHVIAVIYFHDKNGDKREVKSDDKSDRAVGIKVLPRTTERIIMYYQRVSSAPQVERVELYLHDNPFFDTYPTSAALRYHSIPLADLLPHLADARPVKVEGDKLRY